MSIKIKPYNPDAVLCYIENQTAYFTTCDLKDQWGDDWNDAPYEHNAGPPYEWYDGDSLPKYEVYRLKFYSHLSPPERYLQPGLDNFYYSVEQINQGKIPWLHPWRHDHDKSGFIYAGEPMGLFIEKILALGGKIFLEVEKE